MCGDHECAYLEKGKDHQMPTQLLPLESNEGLQGHSWGDELTINGYDKIKTRLEELAMVITSST